MRVEKDKKTSETRLSVLIRNVYAIACDDWNRFNLVSLGYVLSSNISRWEGFVRLKSEIDPPPGEKSVLLTDESDYRSTVKTSQRPKRSLPLHYHWLFLKGLRQHTHTHCRLSIALSLSLCVLSILAFIIKASSVMAFLPLLAPLVFTDLLYSNAKQLALLTPTLCRETSAFSNVKNGPSIVSFECLWSISRKQANRLAACESWARSIAIWIALLNRARTSPSRD